MAVWTFASGAGGVPAGGFGALTNALGEEQRFVLGLTATPEHLPSASTCGFQLNIPLLAGDAAALRPGLLARLREAVLHGDGFFRA